MKTASYQKSHSTAFSVPLYAAFMSRVRHCFTAIKCLAVLQLGLRHSTRFQHETHSIKHRSHVLTVSQANQSHVVHTQNYETGFENLRRRQNRTLKFNFDLHRPASATWLKSVVITKHCSLVHGRLHSMSLSSIVFRILTLDSFVTYAAE